MRRTSISTTWTPGVDLEDARVLIRTLDTIFGLLRRHMGKPGQYDSLPTVQVFGAWTIPGMPRDAAYSSIEWYLNRSLDDTGSYILASRYIETVRLEPWQLQNPHFDLSVTDLPIVNDLSRWSLASEVTGISRRGLVSLISTRQFGAIANPNLRRLALEQAFAHFFGCLLDTPVVSRTEQVERRGGDLYCTNICAMRYAGTPDEFLRLAQQQAAVGVVYCEACQRDMIGQITAFYYGTS